MAHTEGPWEIRLAPKLFVALKTLLHESAAYCPVPDKKYCPGLIQLAVEQAKAVILEVESDKEKKFSINDYGFSIRTRRILKKANITTEKQFLLLKDYEVLSLRNVGKTVLREIMDKQAEVKKRWSKQ